MHCKRCGGRQFLDRVFTDNVNFEAACLHCGAREFISKTSKKGTWLAVLERRMERAQNGLV